MDPIPTDFDFANERALIWQSELLAHQKFALLALSQLMEETGERKHSHETIGSLISRGRAAVSRVLKGLRKCGAIDYSSGTPRSYLINHERLQELSNAEEVAA